MLAAFQHLSIHKQPTGGSSHAELFSFFSKYKTSVLKGSRSWILTLGTCWNSFFLLAVFEAHIWSGQGRNSGAEFFMRAPWEFQSKNLASDWIVSFLVFEDEWACVLNYIPTLLRKLSPVISSSGYLTLGYSSATWAVLFFPPMRISSHSANQNFLQCWLMLVFLPVFPSLIESNFSLFQFRVCVSPSSCCVEGVGSWKLDHDLGWGHFICRAPFLPFYSSLF